MAWSVVIILAAVAVVYLERKMLTNKAMRKEQIVFYFLLASGVILGIVENFIVIPTPLQMFSSIHRSLMVLINPY
ncbi:MAG: hypothetical protein H6Q67_1415 [Firmicutes bacterium]|nr:hypothetical protein [Bacillota bacterium]